MNRSRIFWIVTGVFLLGNLSHLSAQSEQPIIVFFLADDLGWRDLSNAGSTYYETPHIDRIVAEGVPRLAAGQRVEIDSSNVETD